MSRPARRSLRRHAPARPLGGLIVALAVAVPLLGATPAPAGAGVAVAQATVAPTATATPFDPDAPAVAPPPLAEGPLRSGLTPDGVMQAQVPGPAVEPPTISAAGAVLLDPLDGVVLAGVDPRVPRPMASTTKIMTVLLALEALESGRVADTLTVSVQAAATGQLPGVATLGLQAGDVVDVRDLLAADLLRSGNDGAVAIAEHVSGSETAYVAQMNQRSVSLGLEDTRFLDSSGLSDDPAHHATPLDLALLGFEAMGHPDFARWAGADTLDVPPFGVLENRNELIGRYEGTTGVKTGFTTLAGQCLVASVERDGRVLYAVVLGSEDRVSDTTALFDHGFQDYARPVPLAVGQVGATYRTSAGEVTASVAEELGRTVSRSADVRVVTRLAPDVALPIAAGTPLGEAVLVVDGEEVDRVALQADAPVVVTQDDAGAALGDALRAFARLATRTAPVPL